MSITCCKTPDDSCTAAGLKFTDRSKNSVIPTVVDISVHFYFKFSVTDSYNRVTMLCTLRWQQVQIWIFIQSVQMLN